ncbi:FGGY family carbohydrate kinase [Chitinophaga sp. MM2321]|uniref:FGGY-family carbohydrate kinase n=1 Tax=Chitinophaga sp. MM2321 TaxID=3137178 RepID=UPI0032D595E5
MAKQDAYIVIDIGTGNIRVAVTGTTGQVLGIARDDIHYTKDELYPEALYFDPGEVWQQVTALAEAALQQAADVEIKAFTATSQREGIVLIGKNGESLIGLPNIDHRGREWEPLLKDKDHVYRLTGRYPTSLFSAFKLIGIREKRPDLWNTCSSFLSISDWVEFMLCGIQKYEHSQASETLLYDVDRMQWSDELCAAFNIDSGMLPPVMSAGTVIGRLQPGVAAALSVATEAVVIAGGGDTQLAVKSTGPLVEDMVIVSGTTTPIVKIVDSYTLDSAQRTWTSRDVAAGRFVFEANAGVTGLNYQRLKEIFYPNEGYDVIEAELKERQPAYCTASLGSLVAGEKKPLVRGGFIFPAPVSHQLSRACFVWATMVDIACSIAENYRILAEVAGHEPDYVWACGGGLQSRMLRQLIASLINKKIRVRAGFEHASVMGAALICNEALKTGQQFEHAIDVVSPRDQEEAARFYEEWKKTRTYFSKLC